MTVRYERLTSERLGDVVCSPHGLELDGKRFLGDLSETVTWRKRMIELGMSGLIAYDESGPRGFVEYMPAEAAPVPIVAPGAAILTCYHWAGTDPEVPEHLERERELAERAVEEAKAQFTGLATQGWDVPTHFPIPLLEELGFREVARADYIALMWLRFSRDAVESRFAEPSYVPVDLSGDGLLAIDAAFSARCPYGISSETRLRDVVANHPQRDRIRLILHRIDARDEALALAVPPFDWSWTFMNGEEVGLFQFPGEKLAAEIARRLDGIS
jgi:hypothetical protein